MKHTILGAGAIGGMLGTALASLGHDVSLIVRQEKVAGYPKELTLERPDGRLTATAKIVSEATQPADVLWIATKTYQLEEALKSVIEVPPAIVPLLNGVDHIAALRSRYGNGRVIPATIAVEADRTREGHFVQRSPVRLNIASSGERLLGDTAQELRDLGFLCSFIPSEESLLWGKLCFLGPFALVTSASGKSKGEILSDPEWKKSLESAFAEAKAVAEGYGAQIDMGRIQAIVDSSPATMRSSMAKDLAAGRPLELDGIAGPILRGGTRWKIAVPTTQRLVAEIEDHEKTRI
jgi:2-dehydropantoate 2-reductase